jgi:hypothetical protein
MNSGRILAVAAALLIALGSIAPASARITGNGWMNGWTNSWNNGWSNGWRTNGANSGLSTSDHALRVTGFELPSGQPAK